MAVAGDFGKAVSIDFLDLQLEWRQALEAMRRNPDARRLEQLRGEAQEFSRRELANLESRLDAQGDYEGAAEGVRRLMFIEKFLLELRSAGESRHADEASPAR